MCLSLPLRLVLLGLAGTAPALAAAQGNPWRLDLGPYRSVAVTWQASGDITAGGQVLGSGNTTARGLFTPSAVRMELDMRFVIQGKPQGGTAWSLVTAEGQASDNGGTDTIHVEPSLRASLAREFDALPTAGKAKVRANLRRLGPIAAEELDALPTAFAEKTGNATVAGQACDLYAVGNDTVCVLTRAPAVMLRFPVTDRGEGSSNALTATQVQFDVPVPANAFAYPTGKQVVRESLDEVLQSGWAADLYMEGNDGNAAPSIDALARFVMRYLSTEDVEEPEGEPGDP